MIQLFKKFISRIQIKWESSSRLKAPSGFDVKDCMLRVSWWQCLDAHDSLLLNIWRRFHAHACTSLSFAHILIFWWHLPPNHYFLSLLVYFVFYWPILIPWKVPFWNVDHKTPPREINTIIFVLTLNWSILLVFRVKRYIWAETCMLLWFCCVITKQKPTKIHKSRARRPFLSMIC